MTMVVPTTMTYQNLQAKQPKEFPMVEHCEHGRNEEQQHFGEEPFGPRRRAENAELPRRQEGEHQRHADDAAGQGQIGCTGHSTASDQKASSNAICANRLRCTRPRHWMAIFRGTIDHSPGHKVDCFAT